VLLAGSRALRQTRAALLQSWTRPAGHRGAGDTDLQAAVGVLDDGIALAPLRVDLVSEPERCQELREALLAWPEPRRTEINCTVEAHTRRIGVASGRGLDAAAGVSPGFEQANVHPLLVEQPCSVEPAQTGADNGDVGRWRRGLRQRM